jgi:Lrp/AsnC family leucine-responsive transcriptional regulator
MLFNTDELDPTDVAILRLLQRDASLTHKEISFTLHKSVAAVHERTRRLKQRGYIRRVVAVLDGRKVGAALIAFSHVLLTDHSRETLDRFEQAVRKFPEVMECFQMTGAVDFILRIATGDMESYRDFYRNKLATLPDISTVQSHFVLSEVKSETAYPI